MKFGKLEDITGVDFTLPDHDPVSLAYLESLEPVQKPELYVGAPVWGHKEWVGKIYPPKSKPGEFLYHYARAFNAIEMNTTYYRVPTSEMVDKWLLQVPEGFKFFPKFPQAISHSARLEGPGTMLEEFIERLRQFGDHLGMPFLQLGPHFTTQKLPFLHSFLEKYPDHLPLGIEFRSSDWFEDDAIADHLRSLQKTFVITDTAGRRDVAHSKITSSSTLVRFAGNNLHPTDYERIDIWVDRLSYWIDKGLRKVVFFIHEPNETFGPELIKYFIDKMKQRFDLNIHAPLIREQPQQGSLF